MCKLKRMPKYKKPSKFLKLFTTLINFLKNRKVRRGRKACDLSSQSFIMSIEKVEIIANILNWPVYLIGSIKRESCMNVHLLGSFSHSNFGYSVGQPKDFDCFKREEYALFIWWMIASGNQVFLRKNSIQCLLLSPLILTSLMDRIGERKWLSCLPFHPTSYHCACNLFFAHATKLRIMK